MATSLPLTIKAIVFGKLEEFTIMGAQGSFLRCTLERTENGRMERKECIIGAQHVPAAYQQQFIDAIKAYG